MQLIGLVLVGIVAGGILEFLLLYLLMPMLSNAGAIRKNYQGIDIPVSVGISLPMTIMIVFAIFGLLSSYDNSYHIFLLGVMSISFLGFIDDMLGHRDTLGFRGHFGQLFKGRLTTGGLKALGGGLIAFFLALFLSATWYEVLLNTFIIALFANMLNLLDLRPGRAGKGFLFFLLIIIGFAKANLDWVLIAPVLGGLLVYLPYDLKAKVMMGDAGSNVLGLVLGYMCMMFLSWPIRVGVLGFLILVHIYTEKHSLTKFIEENVILRTIDNWGRN
ncbi:MAG TPA: hypothetical protein VFC73_09660 [Syntrophomonadaceae bacterium]|nr:hypothetical protein [Syntrophomonadaceae bacterium]